MSCPVRPRTSAVTVAIASRDRVYLDSLAASLACRGLVPLAFPVAEEPRLSLSGVDVLVLDTDTLTDSDLERVAIAQQSQPLVEVVAVAGDSAVAEAVKALRAGVFTVLQHPVADGLLVEALVAAGRRHRHARERLEELNGSESRMAAGRGEVSSSSGTQGGKVGT